MKCPFCGYADTQVKDSRPSEDGTSIRRRRGCPKCHARFSTVEHVQLRDLTVVKKDGTKVPFERDKLEYSIALATRKRNVDPSKISMLVNQIVRQMEGLGEAEIQSAEIGSFVMDALLKLDKVAYIRYASVYKNFSSTADFEDFVAHLTEKKDDGK